jgi:hypothetical protein
MAMPLDRAYEMLSNSDRVRVAEDSEMFPNFEIWFASNDVEREALREAITADLHDGRIAISPIELQIAYKLRLAQHAASTTVKDFEDALHLYHIFEEQFKTPELEAYVEELGVEDYYAELEGV